MAMQSPMFLIRCPTMAMTTKAGSRAQNSTPGVRSIPGKPRLEVRPSGRRGSAGPRTPRTPDRHQRSRPAMPMSGDQTRQSPGYPQCQRHHRDKSRQSCDRNRPRRLLRRAPRSPGRARWGRIVAAISISTVPDTTGVMIRRSSRQPERQRDVEEGRRHGEAGQQGRSTGHQGQYRDSDIVGRGSHDQDVPRAEPPKAAGLQRGESAGNHQGREHRPGEIGVILATRPRRDGHDQNDSTPAPSRLEADAEGPSGGKARPARNDGPGGPRCTHTAQLIALSLRSTDGDHFPPRGVRVRDLRRPTGSTRTCWLSAGAPPTGSHKQL